MVWLPLWALAILLILLAISSLLLCAHCIWRRQMSPLPSCFLVVARLINNVDPADWSLALPAEVEETLTRSWSTSRPVGAISSYLLPLCILQ